MILTKDEVAEMKQTVDSGHWLLEEEEARLLASHEELRAENERLWTIINDEIKLPHTFNDVENLIECLKQARKDTHNADK